MTSFNTKINFHRPAFLLFGALIILSIAFYGITKYLPAFSSQFLPNQTYTDLNATPKPNTEFRNEAPRADARGIYPPQSSLAALRANDDSSHWLTPKTFLVSLYTGSFMRAQSASAQRGEESGSASSEPSEPIK